MEYVYLLINKKKEN